jgi:acyl dehydratase
MNPPPARAVAVGADTAHFVREVNAMRLTVPLARLKQRSRPFAKNSVPKLFWEDFVEGSLAEYGPRLVTREEIVAFAAEFDPQPMHLDEDAARATMLAGLAASGWHTCVLVNRLLVDGLMSKAHSMGAPGVDEVKWLRPVRPGDRLAIHATVLEKRASRSRPEMGFVSFQFDLRNQAGESVMTLTCPLMVARRSSVPANRGAAEHGEP